MKTSGIFLTIAAFLFIYACNPESKIPEDANIVLFLVDDMGWTDLGCYGSDILQVMKKGNHPHISTLIAEP